MESYLITFKPDSENPERGWPIKELQRLVKLYKNGKLPEEDWRFQTRNNVVIGSRVFLLQQGKKGPAIIGYGKIIGLPYEASGTWFTRVRFENIVDSTSQALATKDELENIENSQNSWRAQASGIKLPTAIADELEQLVIGRNPKNINAPANPDWTRDELIVALDFYLGHNTHTPSKKSPEIEKLSKTIRQLSAKLFPAELHSNTFRNVNGVYMKLMNFRRFDPQYQSEGKTGLRGGAYLEEEVWNEFSIDPTHCRRVADAIKKSISSPNDDSTSSEIAVEYGIEEAPEGRLLTRIHITRERNRKLIASKLRQVMNKQGKLECEVCKFNFEKHYGSRGSGFLECHHIKPVASLEDGDKTHLDDLALLCSNCHRVIHRTKPWLSIEELRKLFKP